MLETNSPRRLTTLIVLFPLIALFVYGGLSYMFFFYSQQQESKKVLVEYELSIMKNEKELLKEKVNTMIEFINYYDNRSSDKIKEDVKHIVSVTVNLANNLYEKYKDIKSDKEIQSMILSALENIKFEGNIGYLFVLNLNGDVKLHVDKQMQGTNILNIRDIYGKYIIKEFNEVLKKDSEGFVDYYWYIANGDRKSMHYKISFVKMLNCYDWYIGAGEYLKYMKKFVQKDILKYVSSKAHFNNGYFFIFETNNKMVFHPKDSNPVNLSLYKKIGFYMNNKELSYIDYVREYGWYIVATKSLNEIKENIINKRKQSDIKQHNDMKTNYYLLGVSWLISLLLSLYLSTVINRLLQTYKNQINDSNEQLIFQSRQALIGELFSMISHQWRQPVNKIASILALLRFELSGLKPTYKEIDEKCEEIENSIEFMSETIDDFRTFYKPKDHTDKVHLKNIIEQSLLFLESAIIKKDVQIVTKLDDLEYDLYTNEFQQVMLNLIKNAIDSIKEDGVISIHLYKDSREKIIIKIKDNGEGVDKKNLEKLFDPYFTTKKDSMGLGLYMTKMIIEKHMHGTISVKRLKIGTKFTIIL